MRLQLVLVELCRLVRLEMCSGFLGPSHLIQGWVQSRLRFFGVGFRLGLLGREVGLTAEQSFSGELYSAWDGSEICGSLSTVMGCLCVFSVLSRPVAVAGFVRLSAIACPEIRKALGPVGGAAVAAHILNARNAAGAESSARCCRGGCHLL